MTNARWFIAAVLLALPLTGATLATAQVTVTVEDLIGTWELVSTKDLQTAAAVYGMNDASTGIQWMQFTRSHWMDVAMARGRNIINPADFAKLSPEEKVKTNYARIWNEKNEQIFGARSGTYYVEGNKIHQTPTMALQTAVIGVDRVLKVTRLDKSTMIAEIEFPALNPATIALNPTTIRELTYRRIE